MNRKVIFVLADSFRRDHIGAYGNRWIHTPNLDRLAGCSHVFDAAYAGSFPTGPNRRDILVGQGYKPGHAFNPWINIAADEVTLPKRLDRKGFHSQMFTDVANGVTYERNMFKGFNFYTIVRGQEGDGAFSDDAVPLRYEVPAELTRYHAHTYHRIQMARAHRRVEDDYFAPKTFKLACEWLERNRTRENFLLWVETFDPHEPWDAPPWYIERYDPGYTGRVIECPPYGFYRRLGITARELRHIQALYAAECTMVDTAVGRLLATLEKLNLLDEVSIVFTSDHGLYLGREGDAGCVGKPWCVGEKGGFMIAGQGVAEPRTWLPLRTATMRLPLFLKLPGQRRGTRIGRIVQPWDLTPTLLELGGVTPPDELQGQSLLPAAAGRAAAPRPLAFNGFIWPDSRMGQAMNARWIYSFWHGGLREPSLLDLRADPAQERNVASKHPDVCRKLHAALARWDRGGFEGVANPWK